MDAPHALDIVTRYCVICDEERATPADVLAGLERAPALIEHALEAAPASVGDGWSAPEVMAHLADSEIMFGLRVRLILAEPDPLVPAYDEQAWATAFRYADRDVALSAGVFRAARASAVELLKFSEPEAWHRTYRQPGTHGRTLGELLQHRADHDLQHLWQIARG